MNKTIADAVALGIPINHTKGSIIVNIGQSTEISVIEKGRVVLSKIVEIGGKQLNEAIVNRYANSTISTLGTGQPED